MPCSFFAAKKATDLDEFVNNDGFATNASDKTS